MNDSQAAFRKRNTTMHKLLLIALMLSSTSSFAWSSGTVSGQVRFYQHQGNFCPSYRNCTGAKYLASQYHTYMPLAQTKLYVKNVYNQVIGQGVTDTNGNYSISWLDGGAPNNSAVNGYVWWHAEHKDGRFTIYQAGGQTMATLIAAGSLQFGITTGLGTTNLGGANSPNAIANLYDGAWRTWYYALSQSSTQLTYHTNVDIRAFDSTTCPSSCANCANNRIVMDQNSPYKPQARIMHELGHIASCRASQGTSYQQASGNCDHLWGQSGWNYESWEYGANTFEEAFATFFADVAMYDSNAVAPHTCNSVTECSTNG